MRKRATYSVYDKRTDMPVIIGGTAPECAAAMRVALGSFWTIYTKLKRGLLKSDRWEIYRDEGDLDEDI